VAEVLPLLYLHGLSSLDFGPALTQFLGTSHGLSAATITRLTKDWQDEATTSNKRSLAGTDHVYCWVDGIHLKVRLEQDKVCLLVMIGVRADGTKELIALDDGHRESTESSLDVQRGCQRRGMAAPVLAGRRRCPVVLVRGPRGVPETREQRCWWHKIGNVLNAQPKSAQPGAKKALAEIWIHLRITNPIESTFATVRLRQRVTKGPGSRAAGARDGVQAHRISTDPVAGRQRTPPRRAGPCRRGIQERQAHRTTRRIRGW
jgi:putative transposase